MIVVLVGRTASGKSSIADSLCESDKHYHKIVTYTTRPMREGEKQDVDYHFISDNEFEQMKLNKQFTEYKQYNTSHGVWKYGSVISGEQELSKEYYVIILTPQGLRDVSKTFSNYVAFHISVSLQEQLKRLKGRGDEEAQILKRLQNDNVDFRNVMDLVDFNFYSVTSSVSIADAIRAFMADMERVRAITLRHFNLVNAKISERSYTKDLGAYILNNWNKGQKELEDKEKTKSDSLTYSENSFRQSITELQEEQLRLLDKIDEINKDIQERYNRYADTEAKYSIEKVLIDNLYAIRVKAKENNND